MGRQNFLYITKKKICLKAKIESWFKYCSKLSPFNTSNFSNKFNNSTLNKNDLKKTTFLSNKQRRLLADWWKYEKILVCIEAHLSPQFLIFVFLPYSVNIVLISKLKWTHFTEYFKTEERYSLEGLMNVKNEKRINCLFIKNIDCAGLRI